MRTSNFVGCLDLNYYFAVTVFVLFSACAVDSSNGNELKQLHENVHVACSACQSFVRIVTRAIQSPNAQLSGHLVQEQDLAGVMRRVQYTHSMAYANDLLDILCTSPALRQLRIRKGWFGMPEFGYDDVPVYHNSPPSGDKDLLLACSFATETRQRAILVPSLADLARKYPLGEVEAIVCSQVLQSCAHKLTLKTMLGAMLYSSVVQDPTVILRLLPLLAVILLVIACILPASCYSRVCGGKLLSEPVGTNMRITRLRRSLKKYT